MQVEFNIFMKCACEYPYYKYDNANENRQNVRILLCAY